MSILFCTPCYGGKVDEPHFRSCLSLKDALNATGLDHDWNTGRNESLVHRARMEMTAFFLNETSFTHMMWKDADIEFTPDDVAKLWNTNTDIAVAFYSMKRLDMPLSAWKNGKLVKLEDCPKEPFEVDFAGTGFMLIRRKALEAIYRYLQEMEAKAGALVEKLLPGLSDDEQKLLKRLGESASSSYEGPNGRVPALYMTPIHNDGLESEDYHFCRIAREAGFKIMGVPSIKLGHWGQMRYGAA